MTYLIILTWNVLKYLPELFKSLAALTYPQEKFQILVLDSASTDGSREYLKKLADNGQIKFIELEKNLGFCAGNNLGMQYVLEHGAESVVLLNQDMTVDPNFLTELIQAAQSDPHIGAVQSLLLYPDGHLINSLGNQNHILGYGWCEGNYTKIQNSVNKIQGIKEITYASAASVLYKTEMLKKIGLFDENYFSYNEDADLCLRARLAGYKIILAPASIVYHDYHFPTDKNKKRYFWMEKNRFYFVLKFYRFKTLFLLWPLFLAMDIGQFINAVRKGYLKQFFWSRLWFWFNFRKIFKARRAIQRHRQLADKELMKNFAAEIKYQPVNNFLLNKIGNPVMKWYWNLIKKLL